MLGKDKDRIFSHIIEEHISNAAFLWMLRDVAVKQAHHTPATLFKLESRLHKHLKGCLAARPDLPWQYALEMAELAGGGECFVLTTLAFHHGDAHKIDTALDRGSENCEALRGTISALAWLPDALLFPWLKPWLHSEEALYRYLAMAVCSLRRIDPREHLSTLLKNTADHDLRLLARTLRLIGELKRQDLQPWLAHYMGHDDAELRFWASWSATVLGDRKALPFLASHMVAASPYQLRAITTAIRSMDSSQAWSSINALIQAKNGMRHAIIALATLGDPHGISWLLARMEEREHAQIAGEAFTLITGIEINEELEQASADASTEEQDTDDDAMPRLDGYNNLPFPDAHKVTQRWQRARSQFEPGLRYFLGKPIAHESLTRALTTGRQSQRSWAALELALQQGYSIVPNIKAPQEHRL